jgi:hypothetical protein
MMSVPNVPTKKRRLSVMPKTNQKGVVTPQSPQSPLPSNNDVAEKQSRHSKKTATSAANENIVRNSNSIDAAAANAAVVPVVAEPAKALDNAALAELYATCINMSTQNVSV